MKKLLVILLFLPCFISAQDIDFRFLLNLLPDTNSTEEDYDIDFLPASFFSKNRQALRDSMPKNSVAILFSNPVRNRSNDVNYEYHQKSSPKHACCSIFIITNACAPEVGSDAWCTDMKAKPKAEWTGNQTADFAKSCIFK